MSRVIKFRAWMRKKWMAYDVFPVGDTLAEMDDTPAMVCMLSDVILMQFTGLLDKNGKDLDWWEGDILELDGGASGAHVIEWDNNGACFMCGGDELLVNVRDGYKTEKIGNIHTHPELLE